MRFLWSLWSWCYELDRPGQAVCAEAEDSLLRYGELEMNMSTLRLFKNGRPVLLTPKEYRLMLHMMNEPGRVFSKEELCGMIFDEKGELTAQSRALNDIVVRNRMLTVSDYELSVNSRYLGPFSFVE